MKKPVHSNLHRKKGSIGTTQIKIIGWFANQYSTDESTKNNVPGINKKPIPLTPNPLLVGSSNLKPSIFTGCLPPLSFCAKPKAKSQNPQTWMNSNPPGEVGPSIKIGDGRGRILSQTPHLPCRAPYSQRRRFSFALWNVDSATPGKPCVQNDLWVRWQNDIKVRKQNGYRNPFIQVCIDKRLDVIRSN